MKSRPKKPTLAEQIATLRSDIAALGARIKAIESRPLSGLTLPKSPLPKPRPLDPHTPEGPFMQPVRLPSPPANPFGPIASS